MITNLEETELRTTARECQAYAIVFTAIALWGSAMPSRGADERFDWMPPESVAEAARGQEGGAGNLVPDIGITAVPKPTADASRFTNDYGIDLKAFQIRNDDRDPEGTSRGLNAALQQAKVMNANRIVFPRGTYRICETNPVVIDHSNTIIDLNGATLQIQSNGLPKYTVMVVVDGADTVRVCNGFLAGDKDAHDYKSVAGTHEWGAGITFAGGRNVEVDHLVISNMTGDGAVSGSTGTRTRPELLARIMHSVEIKNLEPGAFTETGTRIDSREKTRTIRPYDLARCAGEFEFGYTMGYQGYPVVKSREYQAFFYDAGTNFVGQLKCLQFRKVAIPSGARFLHLEFNQPVVESSQGFCGRITNFQPPTDVHFHHNTLSGNRRLGMAYCGGQRWLIEANRFEGNGGTAPGFGIDLEDGWELMQDVVLRNNTFKGNRAGDLVICAGSELIVESNTFEKAVVVWGRPHNYIFRNNRFTGGSVGYKTRTGVASIHDNRYENCTLSIVFDTKAVADGLYRPPGKTVATPPLVLKHETLSRVKAVTGTYFCFENSRLEDVNLVAGAETRRVALTRCEMTNTVLRYEEKGPAVAVTVEACQGALSEEGPGLARKITTPAAGAH